MRLKLLSLGPQHLLVPNHSHFKLENATGKADVPNRQKSLVTTGFASSERMDNAVVSVMVDLGFMSSNSLRAELLVGAT